MKYAIIGSGKIGTALARAFARKEIDVGISNFRGSESLICLAKALGPSVHPQSIQDVHDAEIIFLAVPFPAHRDAAKTFKDWNRKIVVDAMNALYLSSKDTQQFAGLLSSEVVARAFGGARLVKGFNHLPAELLTAAKPKARYGVVPQRFKNWTLPRLLPVRMLDAAVAKQMELNLGFLYVGAKAGDWLRPTI